MKVLSLGAGVQSSAMYLMSSCGEMERADLAIFADTGWEPKAVYEHLERLKALNGIEIVTVSKGNIREDALRKDGSRVASMPLFTKDMSHKISMLRRQCTREYKVAVLQREMRKRGATMKDPWAVWIGISVDEAQRMKDSFVKYTYHTWPLIDAGLSRADCRAYLEKNGWSVPKSSCIGCPFHDDHYWEAMKRDSPAEFADAVDFDKKIRTNPRLRDETFIHRSATPLDEAVLSGEAQLDLFQMGECEGYCGV